MRVGSRKIEWRSIKDIGIIITPLVLFFLPIEWLQGERSVCLIKNIFGVECWGCGITRAIVSTVQFEFTEAYRYNKLIVIVFPLLVYVWGKTLILSFLKTCFTHTTPSSSPPKPFRLPLHQDSPATNWLRGKIQSFLSKH